MTRKLFTSALYAGLAAGLVAALLQIWLLVPIILKAEQYESGELVHFINPSAADPEVAAVGVAETSGLAKAEGLFQRNALTFFMNFVTYTGFALLLVVGFAIAERAGHKIAPRQGVIWGAAAFVALHLAPAIGLPPELPGVPAADLFARQVWWVITVILAVVALLLLGFVKGPVAIASAVALFLAPQLVGAPELASYGGAPPPELGALFAARSMSVSAVIWLTLGSVAGYFWRRSDIAA
ncbi:MAG: CbtA family protein [Halocynthiibacter sp.]